MVVLRLPDSWSNWSLEMLVCDAWGEGKTGVPGEKPLAARDNQQQTQPTYCVVSEIWTRATLLEGECNHQCATLAPPTSNRLCVLTVSDNFIEFFLLCSPTEANKPSSHKCSQPHHHTDMDKTCADQSGHTGQHQSLLQGDLRGHWKW